MNNKNIKQHQYWFWAEGGWMCAKCIQFVRHQKCKCVPDKNGVSSDKRSSTATEEMS